MRNLRMTEFSKSIHKGEIDSNGNLKIFYLSNTKFDPILNL